MSQPFPRARKFDGAYCTVDTFRHLLTDRDAVYHLQSVSRALTGKGIYILGLHVLPRHGILRKSFRWQGTRGKLRVGTTIKVLNVNTRRREETLGYNLHIKTPTINHTYKSVYRLRTYNLNQFKRIVTTGGFEIIAVYDVDDGYSGPLIPDPDSENLAFVLRKNQVIQ